MRIAQRYFELLLHWFPKAFRARFGDGMRQAFEAAWAEHRVRGSVPSLAFLARTTADVVASGLRERVRPGRRVGRGSPPGVSWLDVKLGVRMLRKHPGLTLASVFALAVGIPVGLGPGHFVDALTAPLPVPDGGRIRSLRLWSPAAGRVEDVTVAEYESWRASLGSFESMGAYRQAAYNVDTGEGGAPVRGAQVTASTFRVLRVPAALGRSLDPADEDDGAERVVVLGDDVWRSRFAGDPAVIGTTVRLGDVPHTVVGVMPEGFLFPEREQLWLPLPRGREGLEAGATPVRVFGRLQSGVDPERAERELHAVAMRRDGTLAERDPRVRAQVSPFAYAVLGGLEGNLHTTREVIFTQALSLVMLLVACMNVGMLVFARTASRSSEIAVRTALGAGRARIVTQIFVECLVMALLACAVGLVVLGAAPRFLPASLRTILPYWMDFGIDGRTVVGALALAAVSAGVAGILPALRFTGRSVQRNLRRSGAGRTGVRFGGLSGVLIVLDVAVAVSAIGIASTIGRVVREARDADAALGIPTHEFLAVSLRVPQEGLRRDPQRMAETQTELVRRLRAEPGVRAVAVADALPRMEHAPRAVEVEGEPPPEGRRGHSMRTAWVALDFFEELDQPILAGRAFDTGDLEGDRTAVIVNTGFVDNVLGGTNALGRRIRTVPWGDGEPGPWLEIVGVVGPMGMRIVSPEQDQGLYRPFAPGDLPSIRLGIRVGVDPLSFVPRLRALAGAVDPTAAVTVTGRLSDLYEGDWYVMRAVGWGGVLLVAILLAMAASGIYAMMSHAVTRRTPEIGIRTAIGAGRWDVARAVGRRAAAQLALGVVLGMPVAALGFIRERTASSAVAGTAGAFALGIVVMVVVGLVACTGPTRRALSIPPDEALRGQV